MRRREIPLLIAVFLDLMAFGLAFPDLAIRARDFGAPGWVVGAIYASLFAVQFVAAPLWGRGSDRIGRKPVIVVCTLLSSLSMVAYALAVGVSGLFLSRILAGVAAANVVAAQAYLADVTSERERGGAMGRIGAALSAGLIAGPALGGWIAEVGGSAAIGWTAATASLIAALVVAVGLPSVPPGKAEASPRPIFDFGLLRQAPGLRPLFLLALVSWFALACLEGTFVPLVRSMFEFPQEMAGLTFQTQFSASGSIFAFESLVAVLVQGILYAWISRRFGVRALLALGLGGMGLGLLATPFAPSLGALFAISGLFSLGLSIANPTIHTAASRLAPRGRQGEVFGLLQSARAVGFWLGPLLGNALFDWRPSAPYLLAGGVGLAAAFLAASLIRVLNSNDT
jgi:MFS family permease